MTILLTVKNEKNEHYKALADNALLVLIRDQRDVKALTELYQRYRAILGRFLQRRVSDAVIVEEVYNDVMLSIWRKAHSFRGDSEVSTWIFAIGYRIFSTHLSKETRQREIAKNQVFDDACEKAIVIEDSLHVAITQLSESHRIVIELAYFHGYSMSEIAEIVGCPENTVKTRLYHARKNLRQSIEAENNLIENTHKKAS